MSIATLAKWVLGLLDALALFSIYATTEIRIEAGLLVLTIFLVRTLGIRLRSLGLLVSCVLGFVSLGFFVALKFHVYPIIVAAHVGVVVHALLWLGEDDVRDRVLRLTMGFVNLTLASALTTDFYLFGSIFAFAILGSIYISLGFLESSFKSRVPEQLGKPLPKGYLKNMLSVSFAVFLISVLLFPLIPRTSWKKWDGSSYFQVGFNETVDLSASGQSSSRQSGGVALRIISQTPELSDDAREAIPWGLLKGKTLALFDGTRWLARSSRHIAEKKVELTRYPMRGAQFEVIREPQVNRIVFKPYGALISEVGNEQGRSHYLFKAGEAGRELEFQDAPDEKDLDVPAAIRNPRLLGLARSIMDHGQGNLEKAHLLVAFYRAGFTGTLDATQTSKNISAVLENFLMKGKKGSCELFAASAAILLRLQNVPARVIAGYRVNRQADGGMLTVLDADAHAWVEYWNENRGWLPLDPTPHVLHMPSWFDSFEQLYWRAEGTWFYWMINFRKDEPVSTDLEPALNDTPANWSDWSDRWKNLSLSSSPMTSLGLLILGGLLTLGLFAKIALGFLRLDELQQIFGLGLPWTRRRLYFEYLKHERVARKLAPLAESSRSITDEWQNIYLRLRFGRPPEAPDFQRSISRLGRLTRELRLQSPGRQ